MYKIEDCINGVKLRPRMYVTEVRLDYIYYYIIGKLTHFYIRQLWPTNSRFYNEFYDWVYTWAKDVNPDYSYNGSFWYRIIYDNTSSEDQAFEVFFELCDKFFEHCSQEQG